MFQPLNPPLLPWAGHRVWLVGASSGIGQAAAEALLAQRAMVYVSARGAAALDDIAARWPAAVALPLDVTDAASVRSAAATVLQDGPLDLVVYCAGHWKPMRATEFDLPELLRHQQVNYVGALHVLDAVLPALLAQRRGHVSLVASVAGYRGLPRGLAYGPTKAALIHLAETLYQDLRPRGIGVSVVNPGFVATPMTAANDFPMPAMMQAHEAAQAMLHGWARGHFEIHFPRRLSWLLKALSLLPFGAYQAAVRRVTGL